MRIFLYLFSLLLFSSLCSAQDIPFGDYQQAYPFLNTKENKLILPKDNQALESFFSKLTEMQKKGNTNVRMLHIGDSHIQADFFSGRVRQRFHQTFYGCNAGLELVFPYKTAKTNGSYLYAIETGGEWTSCRNILSGAAGCNLGITGISVTTADSAAWFSIRMRKKLPLSYDFNQIAICTSIDSVKSFNISVPGFEHQKTDTTETYVCHFFKSDAYVDSTCIFVAKSDSMQKQVTINSVLLGTGDPGIIYNSTGINGADVAAYLRCPMFGPQLKVMSPELVIISLGTNDCYMENWDSALFEKNLDSFVALIQKTLNNPAIILTTPGDHFRKRKYYNTNLYVARNIIFRIAEKHQTAIWDLHTIMGGYKSILDWVSSGLAVRDKIHFTKEGYFLQGDLLFEAIISAWSDFITKDYAAR
ncbi:MAG: hypothetical protein CVU05_01415 [Bacteroidetes bacterium HGW-Bacteroidetes-21]|jgi:lysophospholipase L1-like esterase|nr:MAG: hypothetical protein CVU05_01415 [Bacteroidetes bacterium HGW-Bacteroidetes-21]